LTRTHRSARIGLLGAACAAALIIGKKSPSVLGYAAVPIAAPADTTHPKGAADSGSTSRIDRSGLIPGYLSSWGLPPLPGAFSVTDTGLVFHSATGDVSTGASSFSLAYIEEENGRAHYIFRITTGVFETEAPGPLLDAATHPVGMTTVQPASVRSAGELVQPADPAAALRAARLIGSSAYADSLYALFGQPRAPVGLIGRRGRAAGRLGEYIAARDSLALDPARMTCEAQLRHALAHELGHRWQLRAKAQLAALWTGVPGIRDPKRYGYGDQSEHQAEAIAFAVNFLQTTGRSEASLGNALALLEHYELLVPGTRALTRYLLLQPIYRDHPLRSFLTTTPVKYALEK
jgi:hypothetical protein